MKKSPMPAAESLADKRTASTPALYRWNRGLVYLTSVLLPLATLMLHQALRGNGHLMLVLMVLPIILSALLGGLWPGLVATATSALATDYFLIPPLQGLGIDNNIELLQWLFLIANGVVVSILSNMLQGARLRLQTAYQELEHKVAERTRDLTAANQQLTITLDTLQKTRNELVQTERLASLGSMVAGVAHELNTPLGNALLASSSLQDSTAAMEKLLNNGMRKSDLEQFMADVREATDITVRNLSIASGLVHRFKEVAVDQTHEQRREFDLRDCIEGILTILGPTLRKQPCTLHNRVPAGELLHSYPGSLGQVLANLINNALVHAFENNHAGEITLSAEDAGPEAIALLVEDNGAGMTSAVINRIFDPFFTTRMGRGGTGLGLYITLNIVENILGGSIKVNSKPGEGTRFRIVMLREAPALTTQAMR
jgi:C4-dicarboxylate-specific signal transduction histidine kinase